jgi:hypothetical protein
MDCWQLSPWLHASPTASGQLLIAPARICYGYFRWFTTGLDAVSAPHIGHCRVFTAVDHQLATAVTLQCSAGYHYVECWPSQLHETRFKHANQQKQTSPASVSPLLLWHRLGLNTFELG